MKERPQEPVSVVFLAFNEATTIEREVLAFSSAIVQCLPGSELIVAEDGSSDGTTEILQRLQQEGIIVHLTSRERKGYRRALLDAVNRCANEFVFFSDTGLKHDPMDFWKLYPLRHDYDMIVGRKTDRKDQAYRRLFTWGYNRLIRFYFDADGVYDCDSGFRLFNRGTIERFFKSDGLFFRELPNSEIVVRLIHAGMRYHEVPVSYAQRTGTSRGLPPKKLPGVILGAIQNLRKLKCELRRGAGS